MLIVLALAACGAAAPADAAAACPATRRARATILPTPWVGVIGTGQSLSVGVWGDFVSVPPHGSSFKLADSSGNFDVAHPEAVTLSAAPLTEPLRTLYVSGSLDYPTNIVGLTPHAAMAGQLSVLAQAAGAPALVSAHSAVGIGSAPMSTINKGGSGHAYAASLFEARALTRLATAAGAQLTYGSIILTHGESDELAGSQHYGADLMQLWQDYNADLRAITGQTQDIPVLLTQQHSFPQDNSAFPAVTQAQWQAGNLFPGKLVVVGPKYQYHYADQVHLNGAGYRALGEKYAQVHYAVVDQHRAWRPLQPRAAAMTATQTVRITFDVPIPPLAWDEGLAPPHQAAHTEWAAGRGFEVLDSQGTAQTIASVQLHAEANAVDIQLQSAPTHLPLTVQYAMTQDASATAAGLPTGRRGQLRDSDPFVGNDAERVACLMSSGSPKALCPGGLTNRTIGDIVEPQGVAVTGIAGNYATLAAPWQGAHGSAALLFHSNQFNYCVAFSLTLAP